MTDDAPYEPSGQTMAVMGWTPEDQPAKAPRAKAKPDLSALRRFIWSLDLADRAEVLLLPPPATTTPPPEYSEALAIVERHQDGEGEGPSGTEIDTVFTAYATLLEKHLPFARAMRAEPDAAALEEIENQACIGYGTRENGRHVRRALYRAGLAVGEAERGRLKAGWDNAARGRDALSDELKETKAELERLRAALAKEQRLHAETQDTCDEAATAEMALLREKALLRGRRDELAKALNDSFEELGVIGARSIADFVWDLFAPLRAELKTARDDLEYLPKRVEEKVEALQRENAELRAQAKWAPTRDAILNALRLGRINAGAAQTVDNSTADEIQKLLATPRTVRTTEIA